MPLVRRAILGYHERWYCPITSPMTDEIRGPRKKKPDLLRLHNLQGRARWLGHLSSFPVREGNPLLGKDVLSGGHKGDYACWCLSDQQGRIWSLERIYKMGKPKEPWKLKGEKQLGIILRAKDIRVSTLSKSVTFDLWLPSIF